MPSRTCARENMPPPFQQVSSAESSDACPAREKQPKNQDTGGGKRQAERNYGQRVGGTEKVALEKSQCTRQTKNVAGKKKVWYSRRSRCWRNNVKRALRAPRSIGIVACRCSHMGMHSRNALRLDASPRKTHRLVSAKRGYSDEIGAVAASPFAGSMPPPLIEVAPDVTG